MSDDGRDDEMTPEDWLRALAYGLAGAIVLGWVFLAAVGAW